MTTRWIGYSSMFCCLLVGCAAEETQNDTSRSNAANAEAAAQTEASPLGRWAVSEALLYGNPDQDRVGVAVVINNDGTADWQRLGQAETIEFVLSDANPDGSIPFKTANGEDQIAMGGAGPRHGLLRVQESGELEIIEATSASEAVPTDFSKESRQNV